MKKFILLFFIVLSSNVFAQFSGGSGTEENPYQISTAQDLNNIKNYLGVAHYDKYYKLMNDIDLTSFLSGTTTGWEPIGKYLSNGDYGSAFMGHFDGNGRKITGLWIDIDNSGVGIGSSAGLFGYVIPYESISGYGISKYNFKNLGIETNPAKNIKCSNTYYVGILCGYLTNVWLPSVTIDNCYVKGNIDATNCNYVGKLLGTSSSFRVNNCYAIGDISATMSSSTYIGGLVGFASQSSDITMCYSEGNIQSVSQTGLGAAGLLIGLQHLSQPINCYSKGITTTNVTSNNICGAGGIVGYNSYPSMSGTNCYTSSEITGSYTSPNVGAFFGFLTTPSIERCYYNSDLSGTLPPVGNQSYLPSNMIVGLTTSQMKHQSNFVDWNFNTIWKIDEGSSMPYLQIIEKDALLSELTVSQGYLSPSFDKHNLSYTVNYLSQDITSITISAKANYPRATVIGTGTKTLNAGTNTFNIVVTSQDGSVQHTYTIVANKNASAVENVFLNEIVIYPNPVKNQLRIKNYELREGDFTIFNVAGQAVGAGLKPDQKPDHNGEITIDVSHLPSGVYFIKAGNMVGKFIKE